MKATLDLFNKAIAGNSIGFQKVNELAVRLGYLVHPDCCTAEVLAWLKTKQFDYNSTFYKSWTDIISKTRAEIWVDQILAYWTGYAIEPEGTQSIPSLKNLKAIEPITLKEASTRAISMLYSGIALKQETIDQILEIAIKEDIELDKVKNKEAKMILYKTLGLVPNHSDECMRYAIYLATGSTMLIKDKKTIQALKASRIDLDSTFQSVSWEILAESFYRFKPLWLAFRNSAANKVFTNKLRKYAKTYHKPKAPGFWQNILSDVSLLPQIEKRLPELNNFKKVALLQTILIRGKQLDVQPVVIRNQKLWVNVKEPRADRKHLQIVFSMIYQSLCESISGKATTFYMPENLGLKFPTSEKSFVGNYPLGTSFDFPDQDGIIGIHRRAENADGWFDFSLNGTTGIKIGWNRNFVSGDKSITFSGDIQDPSCSKPVAELFYLKNGFNGTWFVKVNDFSGKKDVPYQLFLANEKINTMRKNYMVDPNNILFTIEMKSIGTEDCVGILHDNKLILVNLRTGSKIVSGKSITDRYADYTINTVDCFLDIRDTLVDAGFTPVADPADAEIDFSNLSKDTLMDILTPAQISVSDKDMEVITDIISNPPAPNERLKQGQKNYNKFKKG